MLLNQANFDLFKEIISLYDKYVIIPHYNPDPDAIASAFAMQHLLSKGFDKQAIIAYSGIIGRAENNVMLDVLGIKMDNISDSENLPEGEIILLDTQPLSGNNPLKDTDTPLITIDHHELINSSKSLKYADVRPEEVGSTSTIMCEYYEHFKVKIPVNVATALYYGIQTDVTGEARTGYNIDFEKMEILSKCLNKEKLFKITNPKLPFDYYTHVQKGMQNCIIYDELMISTLGEIENPDYIAEIADLLIRYEKGYYILMIGIYKDTILLSFRSQRKKIDAGQTIKKIVGTMGSAGGHSSYSGGRIKVKEKDDSSKIIRKLMTKALEILYPEKTITGIPFLSMSDYIPQISAINLINSEDSNH